MLVVKIIKANMKFLNLQQKKKKRSKIVTEIE